MIIVFCSSVIYWQLARRSDVYIENYIPGKMDSLGLGYEALSSLNPQLIYCSITGFGATGPYAKRGGYDVIAAAMSGLMHITGPQVWALGLRYGLWASGMGTGPQVWALGLRHNVWVWGILGNHGTTSTMEEGVLCRPEAFGLEDD